MSPTPDMLAQAHLQGYVDGMQGNPLPDIHEALVDAYAEGRRNGTARSGRLPKSKPGLFDTEFCREVLARPTVTAPEPPDVPVPAGASPSTPDEAP